MTEHAGNGVVITKEYYDETYYRPHAVRLRDNDRFTRVKLRRLASLLRPQKNERILDLGSGVGTIMIALTREGVTTIGMDYSMQSLRLAASYFKLSDIKEKFNGVCSDGKNIAVKNGSFHGVAAFDFTEHLDDSILMPVVAEVYRILKKGGRFAIYTPNKTHLFEHLKKRNILLKEDKSHIGLRTMKEYIDILTNTGFCVKEAYFEPTHIPVYGFLERLLIPVPCIGDLARRRICICAVK
jgi:cyclopropane fatty-acyl-phospholipid synthase-like methyltransferase